MKTIANNLLISGIMAIAPLSVAAGDFEDMMASSTSASLPLINLTVDVSSVNGDDYTSATIEIYDMQGRTNNSTYVTLNCKVKYRGTKALEYDKKSFGVKLYDSAGEDLDVAMFGIREENSWILDAMAVDRVRMRNRVCFDIWNDMDVTPYETDYSNRNGTEGLFVELFLNSEYHGLYCFTDKIDRKLLGLKKIKEDDDGTITVRGVLYKGESWTDATRFNGYDSTEDTNSVDWNGWELQYPDDYPSTEAWQPLMDVIDFAQSSTYTQDFTSHFYIDNVIDHALFKLAMDYGGCPFKNTFLSIVNKNKSEQFVVTPWNMDNSLGGGSDGEYSTSYSEISDLTDSSFYGPIYSDNTGGFTDGLVSLWETYSESLLSVDNFNSRLDDYADAFINSGAWQREYDKWNNNPVELNEDLTTEVQYVKDWYAGNYENMFYILGLKSDTGISVVSTESTSTNAKRYTIDGRQLPQDSNYTGVVIVEGKKILMK